MRRLSGLVHIANWNLPSRVYKMMATCLTSSKCHILNNDALAVIIFQSSLLRVARSSWTVVDEVHSFKFCTHAFNVPMWINYRLRKHRRFGLTNTFLFSFARLFAVGIGTRKTVVAGRKREKKLIEITLRGRLLRLLNNAVKGQDTRKQINRRRSLDIILTFRPATAPICCARCYLCSRFVAPLPNNGRVTEKLAGRVERRWRMAEKKIYYSKREERAARPYFNRHGVL